MHVAHFLKLFVLKALVASMVAQPVVQLQNGKARGVSMVSGGTYFLGLPFAAPPTKHLRWQPPQPLKPWTHIIDASNFRPACAQLHDWSGRTDNSEDCLYLDVYTPKDNFDMNWQREGPTSPYAVLLFIHGGGFTSGDSAGPASRDKNGTQVSGSVLFNGTYISQKHDVVVVSINYRLGVFGFLGSKELEQRTLNTYGKSAGTGNYGIQDQRAAMKWVQDNIAAFGGDPNRVLIHGCSAGGVSISNHLVSPLSWPYFSSAVMESGNMLAFIDANSMEDAQKWYDGTMSAVGCKDVECLLNVTTDELLKKNQVEASPVVDGHNLLDYPRHLLRNGHVKHVPTIVGATRDELSGLESKILTPRYSRCNESCYHQFLRLNYGDQHLATMLRLYPVSSARVGPEGGPCPGDSSNSTRCTPYYYLIETITTDDALVCTARNVAQLLPAGRDTHMHLHLLMHTYLHLHMHTCLDLHMHTYLHLHACLNVYGCINAHTTCCGRYGVPVSIRLRYPPARHDPAPLRQLRFPLLPERIRFRQRTEAGGPGRCSLQARLHDGLILGKFGQVRPSRWRWFAEVARVRQRDRPVHALRRREREWRCSEVGDGPEQKVSVRLLEVVSGRQWRSVQLGKRTRALHTEHTGVPPDGGYRLS